MPKKEIIRRHEGRVNIEHGLPQWFVDFMLKHKPEGKDHVCIRLGRKVGISFSYFSLSYHLRSDLAGKAGVEFVSKGCDFIPKEVAEKAIVLDLKGNLKPYIKEEIAKALGVDNVKKQ